MQKLLFLFCLLYSCISLGQGGGDCISATFLCDKTNFAQVETQGAGMFTNEISANTCGLSEFNSTWFTWICEDAGNLTFDLIPSLNSDDVDFILFRLPSGVFNCDDKEIMRCMASSCDGATGLNASSMDDSEQPGCSGDDDNYLEEVDLVAGEAYALFILSFSGSGIFDLVFGGSATFQAPIPALDISPDTVACPNETLTFLDQSSYPSGTITSRIWDFGPGATPATASGQGPHNVSWSTPGTRVIEVLLTTSDDCTLDQQQTIIIQDQTDIDISIPVCENGSLDFMGSTIAAGNSASFVLPSTTGCDTFLTVLAAPVAVVESDLTLEACLGESVSYNGTNLAAGTVTEVDFISANGCDSIVTVTVAPVVIADTAIDIETCPDEPITFLGIQYDPGTTNAIDLTSFQGCDSTILLTIVAVPLANTSLTIEACEGETFTYENEELAIGEMMTFTLLSSLGCDSFVNVEVVQSPDFTVDFDSNPFCPNVTSGSVEITNVSGSTGPFVFSIDSINFQDEPLFTGLDQGTYTLSTVDDNNCLLELEVIVEESARVDVDIQNVVLGCTDEVVEIRAIPLGNPNEVSLMWEDSTIGFSFFADEGRDYTVAITDACSTYPRDIEVALETEFRDSYVYIPNGFTPNDDGINDDFKAFFGPDVEVLAFKFNVYNRWGANVFGSTNPNIVWDGRLKGKWAQSGTYIWFMEATLLSCRRTFEVFKTGDIVLIR